jgi:hypothetical protein
LDAKTNVNVGETFFTEEKDNFVNLELQDFGFEEFKRRTIDADETTSTLAVSDSSSGFLQHSEARLDRVSIIVLFSFGSVVSMIAISIAY